MALEHFKLPRDDWYDITNWDYRDKEVYDPSKFTVVGSPVISDDGVASGFSRSDYLTISNIGSLLQSATNWQIEFPVNFANGTAKTRQEIFGGTELSAPYSLIVRLWTDGRIKVAFNGVNTSSYTLQSLDTVSANTKYIIKVKVENNIIYFYLNNILQESYSIAEKVKFSDVLRLGVSQRITDYFLGSIDLKSFSITVDEEEVFKGTKTVQEKVPPKEEIVGRLYKEALIENFNAIEAKLNELSGLTAYETQVPDFSNYNYEDVTLDSPNNKVVNLQSFLKIMNLIGVPIECKFTGKLCNKVTYYDKNMKYHTIVNQKLDDLGSDGKVYIVLDSSNDTVSAVSDVTDLTNKFLLGVYDNGRVYNLRSTGLVDINILTHLCDMSVEPFFIGSLNGTKATEGIYRNGRIIGAWGRESKGAYPKDITLFDIGRQ